MIFNRLNRSIKAGFKAFSRSYEAASRGRRMNTFRGATNAGPNMEIGYDLPTLRNRSRKFVRDNGWAKSAVNAIVNNAVGEGIRPAPSIGTKNQIKKVKELWYEWAESTKCDWDGKSTFYGLQNIIMMEIAEAGDCLIVRRRVNDDIPIKIQVVEGDQLDESKNFVNEMGYACLGVQYNTSGQIIGYWVFPKHPNDAFSMFSLQSEFIAKEDIIHPYEILRAGQVRGVPMGVSSFLKLSDFSDYEDAQLVRQKAAAAYCAFVTGREKENDDVEMLEPGTIQYLNENETITFGNPPKADGYSEYSTKILQGIAASYGITYEMLTKDYSNVNFTSGRMAMLNCLSQFKKWQYQMLVPMVCAPVWDWFINACIISGKLSKYVPCNSRDWTAPRVQMIDPNKETTALVLKLQNGLTSWSEVIRESGRDPDELYDELMREREELKKIGITFNINTKPNAEEEESKT